ncbi:lytic transglycosylase domain-containing protein [Curvibacter sp. CHRR-16]|uniref:lytic transglycosylase domain-containing protein n=1 Tax=Curvibacter sp. CHRR-16 TaxID=2835872 RepID=UPI001BDA84C8|nr:lytic transglycosylase domain-containing protein [Curvibacter sp. CHRR-16]MBT0570918.1 lytic transglycosylase domain-containing protein [Curvibacter sp. CHRR-16]
MQFSAILTSVALASALVFPFYSSAAAQTRDAVALTQQDQTFLDMAQAYRNRDARRMANLLAALQGHPLEVWAAYWELSSRLNDAPAADIEAFMTRYSGSYLEDRLRAEWLQQLGKKQDWATFERELPAYRMNDERAIRCYTWQAHSVRGVDTSQSVATDWLGAKDNDDACAQAAEALVKARKLKPLVVWQRARLGMEMDRLRVSTQALDMLDKSWSKTASSIYDNPKRFLNDKVTALRLQTRELVSLALIRLAYQDPDAAATEMDKLRWRAQLSHEERNWLWGVIGKRAAQKLSPKALGYFEQGQWVEMHEDHLAWAARAALRAGRWDAVLTIISSMNPAQRSDPAWAYWLARAQLARASSSPTDPLRVEAQRSLNSLASTKGFYEMLALEETGQKITVPPKPAPLTADERQLAANSPGLQRALYAIRLGLRTEGVREWNYSVGRNLDDRSLLAAAELACQAEIWDRCINTSERSKAIFDAQQRFPMPHKAAVLARTQQIGLDPAYVYGLIRQESRFIIDARSGVGAAGLMQVMPATAKWTAKKLGMTDYGNHLIHDRDTNIAIGTGYLKLVLDSFEGSMPLAAAAYNAGPSRSRTWRGQDGAPTLEGAIWAENVPFTETRDYVKKVLANTTLYAALITGQPQSLKARMGMVGPRPVGSAEAGLDLP